MTTTFRSNRRASRYTRNANRRRSEIIAHITEVVGVYSELAAEMALLANGYVVSRPSTAEAYDLKAEDPLTGVEVKIQVKTIQVRTDRGNDWVVNARKGNGEPYAKSDADYLIGVLVGEGETPRVFMFENREISEYWSGEARASKRWVELNIALDRTAYVSDGGETTKMEAVL